MPSDTGGGVGYAPVTIGPPASPSTEVDFANLGIDYAVDLSVSVTLGECKLHMGQTGDNGGLTERALVQLSPVARGLGSMLHRGSNYSFSHHRRPTMLPTHVQHVTYETIPLPKMSIKLHRSPTSTDTDGSSAKDREAGSYNSHHGIVSIDLPELRLCPIIAQIVGSIAQKYSVSRHAYSSTQFYAKPSSTQTQQVIQQMSASQSNVLLLDISPCQCTLITDPTLPKERQITCNIATPAMKFLASSTSEPSENLTGMVVTQALSGSLDVLRIAIKHGACSQEAAFDTTITRTKFCVAKRANTQRYIRATRLSARGEHNRSDETQTSNTSIVFSTADVSATYDTGRHDDCRQFLRAWFNKEGVMKFFFDAANHESFAVHEDVEEFDVEGDEQERPRFTIYNDAGTSLLHSIYDDSTDSDDDASDDEDDEHHVHRHAATASTIGPFTDTLQTRSLPRSKRSTRSSRSKGSQKSTDSAESDDMGEASAVDFVMTLVRVRKVSATADLGKPLGNTSIALNDSGIRGINRIAAANSIMPTASTIHVQARSLVVGSEENSAASNFVFIQLRAEDLSCGVSLNKQLSLPTLESDTNLINTYCVVKLLFANIDDQSASNTLMDMSHLSVYMKDTYRPGNGGPKQEQGGEVDYRHTSNTEIAWDDLRAMLTPDTAPKISQIVDRIGNVIREQNSNFQLETGMTVDLQRAMGVGRGFGTVAIAGKQIHLAVYNKGFSDKEWWLVSGAGLHVESSSAPRSCFQTLAASIGKAMGDGANAKQSSRSSGSSESAVKVVKVVGTTAKNTAGLPQQEKIRTYMKAALGANGAWAPSTKLSIVSLPPTDLISELTFPRTGLYENGGELKVVTSKFIVDFKKQSVRVSFNGKDYVELNSVVNKYQKRVASMFKGYQAQMEEGIDAANNTDDVIKPLLFEFDKAVLEKNPEFYRFDPTLRPIHIGTTKALSIEWLLKQFNITDLQTTLLGVTYECLHRPSMGIIKAVELAMHQPNELDDGDDDDGVA